MAYQNYLKIESHHGLWKKEAWGLITLLLLFASNAYGVSFDCIKASTFAEQSICSNEELSKLDDELTEQFKRAQRISDKSLLKSSQSTWLRDVRNSCKDQACLKAAYITRIQELKQVELPPKSASSSHKPEWVISSGSFSFRFTKNLSKKRIDVQIVSAPDNRIVQVISAGNPTDAAQSDLQSLVAVDDFNFDGNPDFSVFNSAGNVQVFDDVFLFDPNRQRFILNSKLSQLPCLTVDPKNKTVSGSCFHDSACNNWSETYTYEDGKLVMQESEGTECTTPPSDYYLEFHKHRDKGVLVTERSCMLDDQKVEMGKCGRDSPHH